MNFKGILQEHSAMLGRIVSSYEADKALQQELMQEVSLALWQALPKFKGEGSMKGYIARIAQNRCISHVSKAVKQPKSAELDTNIPCGSASIVETLEKDQQRRLLLNAVRQLPLSLREVTTLALEGFSHREIGEALNISENNAMVRFSRAKAELKKALARG
ncbi:RNA polymerase sigma factor [Kordiimonas laminariae]|uniref:RNA polymerase sigma factor n=1 Tax=Kordiimonas laminariae TaxID=2917717 RepID=UPI00248CBCCA|nr:sigma-70 family RNA polymerase sigma factor [Kordiimonas laminariae]